MHIAPGLAPQGPPLGQGQRAQQRFENSTAQRPGYVIVVVEDAVLCVTRVTGEKFVSAIARQHDLDARLLGCFCAEVGRYGRGIAEGLVVDTNDLRQALGNAPRIQPDHIMAAVKVPGGQCGIGGFVEALVIESDGESPGLRG